MVATFAYVGIGLAHLVSSHYKENSLVTDWGSMMGQKLELAEVMKALREEIKQAEWAAQGHDLKFNLNNIEVEFQTVVEKEGGLEGGIKFWVLEAKASGKYKNAVTQKIKLTLAPEKEQGGTVKLSPRKPPSDT